MQKNKLVLIGGGGHCKSCIDVIELTNKFEIVGILDQSINVGKKVLNHEIIGTDDDIPRLVGPEIFFLITLGQIKSATLRIGIFKRLSLLNANIATIVSPNAYVSPYANIGVGTIIMHNVIVNANASAGDNCILNTGCIIEHDAVVGNHTHISTQAVINGGCIIGEEVFIGSNTTVANHQNITNKVLVGAGSVVVKNIDEAGVYVGNPIKKID